MVSDRFSFTPLIFNEFQGGYDSIQDQNFLHNLMLQEFNFDDPFPQPSQQPFQPPSVLQNHQPVETKTSSQSLSSSLEILSNYGSRFKRLSGRNLSNNETYVTPQKKLSTEETIRIAGARYVQYSSQWQENFSIIPIHPYYDQFGITNLSEEENRDIELAQILLAAAERIGCKQFERANTLIHHCQWNSSPIGNPVQRVVFHFSQALRERINREILGGKLGQKGFSLKNPERELIEELQGDTNMAFTCHQKLPFNQVMQFACVQAMVEHVESRTKIHLIDLDFGYGLLSSILMQALAERKDMPIELLKITAIGYGCKRELEDAGKRLVNFAETLNLPILYNSVFVVDIKELSEDHFEIEDDEAVAIYCPYLLRTIVSNPDSLDNLMRVIRKIKPVVMIVVEVEATHNSPSFENRFIEALFFFSAYFDCVGTCLKEDNESRMRLESVLYEGIRNIVAMENRERRVRNVKIDVWRRFFGRFRMVETGFSESSQYQANLVVKKFEVGNLCTVEKNDKCIIVGWKGTPIHSLSAWKFL